MAPPETSPNATRVLHGASGSVIRADGLDRHVAYLAAAFAVVVASFLGSTYYAEARLLDVEAQSAAITRDAMPTIVHLAVLRTRLHDLEAALTDAEEGAANAAAATRALEAVRAEMNAERGRLSPKNSVIWDDASKSLASVVGSESALLLPSPARAAGIRAEIGRADRDLGEMIAADASRGRDKGARLDAAEHHVTAIAFGLDAASLVLSLAAVVGALQVVRRSIAMTEERAHELELFASRVAHDIRGPLTPALLGLQRGLREFGPGHRLHLLFERGVRSLLSVGSIVDGLLAFAKAGARPETGAIAPLREAMDGVIADVAPLATERGVELEVSPVPDVQLGCAPGVLVSILSNLARNAVKYIEGGVSRNVAIRVLDRGPSIVRIEVRDTGPGLPAGKESAIFEPYVRATTSKEAGLGLGLATARRLVESHGGRIGVVSRPGEGCTFWFELPSVPPAAVDSAALQPAPR